MVIIYYLVFAQFSDGSLSNSARTDKLAGEKVDIGHLDLGFNPRVVLVISKYDCPTCIETLLDIVGENSKGCVILSNYSIGQFYEKYNVKMPVIYDEKDLFRRQIKYIETPTLIILGAENIIHDALVIDLSMKNQVDYWRNMLTKALIKSVSQHKTQ